MSRGERRFVTVLLSVPGPDGTTRFVDQLVAHPGSVRHRYFSWRAALLGSYDIFHIHWPETLLRSHSWTSRIVNGFACLLLVCRLALSRTPVVRTVHNTEPHSRGGRTESAILALIDSLTKTYICLNPITSTRAGVRRETILHGGYREPFAAYRRTERPSGFVFFGRVEEYKGLVGLVNAFSELPDAEFRLRVVGRATRPQPQLEQAASCDPRISLEFRFVSDAQLVAEVSSAELVVLPYLHMENSGALFVALSLGRPVLVPRSPVNEWLREEFGGDWVKLYDGEITSGLLREAIHSARTLSAEPPTMDGRQWRDVGRSHEEVYRRALGDGRLNAACIWAAFRARGMGVRTTRSAGAMT